MGIGRSVGGRLQQAIAPRGPRGATGATGPTYTGPGSASINVKDAPYNAAGDNVTDDTAAIQAAYDACVAAGGGTIYFPPGVYLLSSALRTSHPSAPGVTFNTQIALWGSGYIPISFVGPAPGSASSWHPTLAKATGAIIRSSATGSGTQPSAIGSATDASRIAVRLHFENLLVMCAPSLTPAANDPTLTALDFNNIWAVTLRELKVTNGDEYPDQGGTSFTGITATHPAARGIVLPHTWATTPVGLYHVQIIGFYAGLVTGEHVVAEDIVIFRCKVAVVPQVDDAAAQNFPARIGKLQISYCQYGIAYATPAAGLTEIPAGSYSHLYVESYENEQGSAASTLWDIYDPNSGAPGVRLVGHVGFGHTPQHHPKVFSLAMAWYFLNSGEVQTYSYASADLLNGWTGLVVVWIERSGMVHVHGGLTAGTPGNKVLTLPSPLRPIADTGAGNYPAINPNTGAYGNIRIDTNGDLFAFGVSPSEFHVQYLSYDRWNAAGRARLGIASFMTNT